MIEVTDAKYIKEYEVFLTFSDGKSGIVDLSYIIKDDGVFRKFKNIEYFKDLTVCSELGTITWRNDLDIAPESLYSRLTGIIPHWVEAS